MKVQGRKFLHLASGAAVRLVAGFPPGGAVDDTLLHRIVFFRPATAMGQTETIKDVSDGGSFPRKRP
jgi:hypothetical protein